MRFTTFRSVTDNRPTLNEGWEAFARQFYVRVVQDKHDVPLYCPAVFLEGTTRANKNVIHVSFGVLDIDKAQEYQVLDALNAFQSLEIRVLFHTTHSHGEGLAQGLFKSRLIVPFNRPVEPDEWDRVWVALNELAGGIADPACKDLSHVYFFPSSPPQYQGSACAQELPGDLVKVDELLACAPVVKVLSIPTVDPEVLARVSVEDKFKFCEAFLNGYPVAIEGQGGDDRTYRAAAIGKDFDLEDLEFWPLLLRWNQRCQPPWAESELWQKLCHANKYRQMPRGWRLADEQSGDVVTEDDLRAFVKQPKTPTQRALRALLEGEPVELKALDDVVKFIAPKFLRASAETLAKFLEPGIKATRGQGHRDVTVKGFTERLKQEQANIAVTRTREYSERLSRQTCKYRDAFKMVGENRIVPYLREEIEVYAKERGFQSAIEFERRWIVRKATSFYFFVAGQYSKPYTKDEALNQGHIALSPTSLQLHTLAPNGALRPYTLQEILDRYSTTAIEILADMRIQKSYFDEEEQKLHEAVCPQRYLVPLFDPYVDRWIDLFAGDLADRLRDWLATFPIIDEPTAAIFAYGAARAGKSLLASALSRLWNVPGPTDLSDVVASFNDALAKCPVVFGDETVPQDNRGDPRTDLLRKLIQERERPLRRKYLATANLIGSARYIIAANNPDILVSASKNLTNKDISAIAERFFVIKVGDGAVQYLDQLPSDVKHNITHGTAITQHMLWLNRNRVVHRGPRFLVEGVRGSELEMRLLTSVGIRSEVCKWIASYIMQPDKLANTSKMPVSTHDNNGIPVLLVTANILYVHWRQYFTEGSVPQVGMIEKALGGVCSERLKESGQQYRIVNLERIRYWVNANGFCSEQEFDAAVAKRGLTTNVIPMWR